MFHMGADVKILAVAACSATAAVGAGLLLARWTSQSIARVSDASARLAAGDLSARAPTGGARELARLSAVVQRHGREHRAALRRTARARRVGEPRPAHAARLDAGDDRGDRGRARRAGRLPPDPARAGPHALPPRRRPVRARPDRRGRADARAASAARGRDRRLGSPPARAGGRGAARRPRRPRRGRDDGGRRAGEDRARALQPDHERPPPHAFRRIGGRERRAASTASCSSRSRTPAPASSPMR